MAAPSDSWWSWAGGGRNAGWTKLGNRYVFPVDTAGYDDGPMGGPQIWLSEDLLHWRRATVPQPANQHLTVTAVTLGGPGLVAIGTDVPDDAPQEMLWTSTDGSVWKPADGSATGLTPGQLWLLRATGGGNVSYVAGPVDVTQFPGDALDDVVQNPHLIVSQGGATGFSGDSESRDPISVWQSIGSNGWHKIGTLPKSAGASVFRAVQGPHGTFVYGCGPDCSGGGAWTSTDGVTWHTSKVATFDHVNAIIADQSGFIAVGQRVTGKGCAVAESDIFGESWTSSDGLSWRKMKDQPQFNHASIYLLIPRDRTLFGVGMRWSADHAVPTVWSTTLPAQSVPSGASTPPPVGTPGGCGD